MHIRWWSFMSCHVVSYLGIFVFIIIIVISYYYCDILKWNSSFLFISIYFAFHFISSDWRVENQMLATPMTMVIMLSTDLSYIIASLPVKLPIISLHRFLLLPLTLLLPFSYFHISWTFLSPSTSFLSQFFLSFSPLVCLFNYTLVISFSWILS